MKTPAFTAEAALYQTNNQYRLSAAGSFMGSETIPQMTKNEAEMMFYEWIGWLDSLSKGGGSRGGGGGSVHRLFCAAACRQNYLNCIIANLEGDLDCDRRYSRCLRRC